MKKNVISTVIAVVLLVIVGICGGAIGVFDGAEGFFKTLQFNAGMFFKVIIVISLIILAANLVLFVLQLIRKIGGRAETLSTVIGSLVKYGAVIIGACWSLSIIGVDVSTIFASLGIVALILGFGAESLVADLVTGVFILFENQFNVGDIIEIGGFRGTVKEIGIRTTSIEDTGKNIKIINNSDLKDVLNRSNHQSVAVSEICVAYDVDLDEIEKKIQEIIPRIKAANSDIFEGEIKYLGVEELADSWIKLKFVADVKEQDIFSGKRRLNKFLKQEFDKEHIAIPFPQVDVHIK